MKVLHVSTSDIGGGAAKAAYKLHNEMLSLGIDSQMLVLRKYTDDESIIEYQYAHAFIQRVKRKWRRTLITRSLETYRSTLAPHYELFSQEASEFKYEFEFNFNAYDIIQLHFIAGFIDYQNFFENINIPVFWRLADMNPITGGCHYSWGCKRYSNSCGNCPMLGSNSSKDLSNKVLENKKKIFANKPTPIHFIALSKWMHSNVKQSALFQDYDISIIPNGVDLSIFRPLDKNNVRESLGIPSNKKVLLLIADHLDNPRKGTQIGMEALSNMHTTNNIHLLLVGNIKSKIRWQGSYDHFGHISNKKFLALVYASADFFISTSLEENFANTIIESMACGTPVIGFNIGGVPDAVIDGETGYLAQEKKATHLSQRIVHALSDKQYEEIRNNAIEFCRTNFNLTQQTQEYIKLYNNYSINKKN